MTDLAFNQQYDHKQQRLCLNICTNPYTQWLRFILCLQSTEGKLTHKLNVF